MKKCRTFWKSQLSTGKKKGHANQVCKCEYKTLRAFSLTWRPRRRLGESEGLTGAISKQWEAPGIRRAGSEGPKAWVTLSTCQGSVSPGKKGEDGVELELPP